MSRERTFNFIPSSQLEDTREKDMIVSFYKAGNQLVFSKKYYQIDVIKNKFIRFYVDVSKRTLAWRYLEEKSFGELKDYAQIKEVVQGKKGNTIVKAYVPQSCVDALKLKEESKYNKLEVHKYKPGGLLDIGEEYYYISFEK